MWSINSLFLLGEHRIISTGSESVEKSFKWMWLPALENVQYFKEIWSGSFSFSCSKLEKINQIKFDQKIQS